MDRAKTANDPKRPEYPILLVSVQGLPLGVVVSDTDHGILAEAYRALRVGSDAVDSAGRWWSAITTRVARGPRSGWLGSVLGLTKYEWIVDAKPIATKWAIEQLVENIRRAIATEESENLTTNLRIMENNCSEEYLRDELSPPDTWESLIELLVRRSSARSKTRRCMRDSRHGA